MIHEEKVTALSNVGRSQRGNAINDFQSPKHSIKTNFIASLLLTICAGLSVISCSPVNDEGNRDDMPALSQEELIKRGKYLVTIGACHDCHSPKVMTHEGPMPDTSRLLSGHPQHEKIPAIPANGEEWIMFNMGLTSFVGPWGVSFSANLTPHYTGTGAWTFEQFKTAIRKGKYKGLEGNRDLLPPMPWQMYRSMTDDDLQSIFAYLKSLKPIDNLVPAPIALKDLKN